MSGMLGGLRRSWYGFAHLRRGGPMSTSIRTIGIIGKYGAPALTATLGSLTEFLGQHNIRILLDAHSADGLHGNGTEITDRDALATQSDLVVVIGGDGTFLDAARSVGPSGTPLLGVNLGRLGFMTDVTRDDMLRTMGEVLEGRYHREQRFFIDGAVIRDGKRLELQHALNDVVITKRDVARMIEFDTFVDGHFVSNHRADGLVVATPTGSTAYALSGGGPVLKPTLEALALVPICPHTLSDRPIVVDASSEIEIRLSENNANPAQATWDGQFSIALENGDSIRIHRARKGLTLLHPQNYDYFAILRDKLHWGRDQAPGQ